MNGYGYDRNTSVTHPGAAWRTLRVWSKDERLAWWESRYKLRGLHRGLLIDAQTSERRPDFGVDHRELPNMTPEQWEEWERAFGPEPVLPEEESDVC